MDFVAVILLLAVFYLRPQEWFGALSTLRPAMLTLGFAIITMFIREGGFSFKSLFRTAHDWLIFAFFIWIMFTADSAMDAWSRVKVFFISYIVIVQAINSLHRLNILLVWWMCFLTFIAVMAILSQFGIDPLGSNYITNEVNKGRLSLNLSLFDNPNALGHSVVPLLLMCYFYFIWKRPLFIKEIGLFILLIPSYCLYLTQSKGAFLSGFIATIIGFTFGRPRFIQILILCGSMTIGWAGLQMLPRMEQMQRMQSDQGVIVRIQAWKAGLNMMKWTSPKGTGIDSFPSVFQRFYGYPKASHSSYVQIGTELGYGGLFLFVGILYCCFRTLIRVRTESETEERIRRVLLIMLVSYTVSSWMIGWGMHLVLYVIAGSIAAFQRLMDEKVEKQIEDFKETVQYGISESTQTTLIPVPVGQNYEPSLKPVAQAQLQPLVPAVSAVSANTNSILPVSTTNILAIPAPDSENNVDVENQIKKKIWRRPRILDVVLICFFTYLVVWFWQFVIKKF